MFILCTNRYEVINTIYKLNLKKGGIENISSKTILLAHKPTLSIYFLKSVQPNDLKCADIKAIHKSNDKHTP